MRCDKLNLQEKEGIIITGYANIFYYSGFTSSDALLLITKNRHILMTDSRYMVQAKQQTTDFEVYDTAEKSLDAVCSELDCDIIGFEEECVTVKQFSRLNRLGKKLVPMQKRISAPRYIKEPEEIEKIAKAEALASYAFSELIKNVHTGMTELDAAFFIESCMRKNGALKTSFDTIVASGIRSSMPHGIATTKILEKGDFVTVDFGCVLDGYCSDMTRTFVLGSVSEEQKKIYNTVLKAQLAAIDGIAVGKKCSDIDKIARDIIADAGYGKNFGHSLGHSVGIEIHENPNFSPRSDDVISKGNVITVEPGIYIDGFGGVRIEDVVAIGENVRNLTEYSKELTII